jgi:hypothetical protein
VPTGGQELVIVKNPSVTLGISQNALVQEQEQVNNALLLIMICSNTSCSVERYGKGGREFYSVVDGTFASMLNLLSAVKERIGARFVGAFDIDKVSKIPASQIR